MIPIIILAVTAIILFFLFIKKAKETKNFKNEVEQRKQELENYKIQYKDIIDVDNALVLKNDDLKKINQNIELVQANFDKQKEQLNQDFIGKRNIYENLLKEISIVEENLEDISYGLYKPHFNYNTSEEY